MVHKTSVDKGARKAGQSLSLRAHCGSNLGAGMNTGPDYPRLCIVQERCTTPPVYGAFGLHRYFHFICPCPFLFLEVSVWYFFISLVSKIERLA